MVTPRYRPAPYAGQHTVVDGDEVGLWYQSNHTSSIPSHIPVSHLSEEIELQC